MTKQQTCRNCGKEIGFGFVAFRLAEGMQWGHKKAGDCTTPQPKEED